MTATGNALREYDATATVQCCSCRKCGSTPLWRAADKPESVSITVGTLYRPTGLKRLTTLSIADASDFHRVDDAIATTTTTTEEH